MRGNSHVRFGGRRRGNHRPKGRHRRLAADPAPAIGPDHVDESHGVSRPLGCVALLCRHLGSLGTTAALCADRKPRPERPLQA